MKKIFLSKILQSKIFLLLAFITVVFIQSVFSQVQKLVVVNGSVIENITKKPLELTSVALLTLKDSSLVKGAITNTEGAFVFTNVVPGVYALRLSFMGYTTIWKTVTIQGDVIIQNLGSFILDEEKSLMNEVVITATLPVIVKKDTLEYNADMFKVEKNAVIEDMLKKLPGVEVDGNGKIKAQGTDIKRIFIDGKPFFGNDPLIATQNLPTEMISKVQVIDKKSDQSEFAGVDDGKIEKIINIITRQGFKHGSFGKITGGYGSLDKRDASVMINNFQDERQFSVIGKIINSGRAVGQSGTGVTNLGGVNFHDKIGKKVEFSGSYSLNGNNMKSYQTTLTQTLIGDSSIFKNNTSGNHNNTISHKINMEINYVIDPYNSILFRPDIGFVLNNSDRNSSIVTNGLTDFKLNESNSTSINNGNNWNSSATLLYRRKFKKPHRTFSLNLVGNLSSDLTDSYVKSDISQFITSTGFPSIVKTNLLNNNTSSGNGFNLRASYTEPLSKSKTLELNYSYSQSSSFSQREAYDYNELNQLYDKPDTTYSNRYNNAIINQRLGISIQTQFKTKLVYTIGLGVESAEIKGKTLVQDTLFDRMHKSVNFSPTASLNYAFTNRRRLNLQYSGSTIEPSIDQLQPIVSDPNSLTIRKGNPDLKSSFSNRLNIGYNDMDIKTYANYSINFQYNNVLNNISSNYINGPSGEQIIIPVNVNGTHDAAINLSMGLPLAKNKYSINTSGSLRWSKNMSYIRNTSTALNTTTVLDTATSKLNTTRTLTAGYNLSGNINSDVILFTASCRVNYNRAWQSVQSSNTNTYISYNFLGDLKLHLPARLLVATDFQYNINSGYGNGYNKNYAIWNASIALDMLKNNRAQLKLQVFDILKQNQNVSRSINGNNITDTHSSNLSQYLILSFVYNLRIFSQPGGKEQKDKSSRNGGLI